MGFIFISVFMQAAVAFTCLFGRLSKLKWVEKNSFAIGPVGVLMVLILIAPALTFLGIFVLGFLLAINLCLGLGVMSILSENAATTLPDQQPLYITPRVIVWFKPEQWEQLRATAADPERLPLTYHEWLAQARRQVAELEAEGQPLAMVMVEAPALLNWLRAEGRSNTTENRLAFAFFQRQQLTLQRR